MTALEALNLAPIEECRAALTNCCGSRRWVQAMILRRPFLSEADLHKAATRIWRGLAQEDWLEAFGHHPRIGDINSIRARFAATRAWAEGEQAGVQTAKEETLKQLAEGNLRYEEAFGYIFIVCATGKSAEEMLSLLQDRLSNPPDVEIEIAAGQQEMITRVRLEKLLHP